MTFSTEVIAIKNKQMQVSDNDTIQNEALPPRYFASLRARRLYLFSSFWALVLIFFCLSLAGAALAVLYKTAADTRLAEHTRRVKVEFRLFFDPSKSEAKKWENLHFQACCLECEDKSVWEIGFNRGEWRAWEEARASIAASSFVNARWLLHSEEEAKRFVREPPATRPREVLWAFGVAALLSMGGLWYSVRARRRNLYFPQLALLATAKAVEMSQQERMSRALSNKSRLYPYEFLDWRGERIRIESARKAGEVLPVLYTYASPSRWLLLSPKVCRSLPQIGADGVLRPILGWRQGVYAGLGAALGVATALGLVWWIGI